MNEAFARAISELQEQMKPLEEQIRPVTEQLTIKKKLINQLCAAAGGNPMYPDVEGEQVPTVGLGPILTDQYFGRPTATVVKEILERRKQSGMGAILLNDLFEAMKAGGFEFDSKDPETARRGVSITLGKNPAFIKIPSTGAWGLAEWYPNARRNKATANATASTNDAAGTPQVGRPEAGAETSSGSEPPVSGN
jgi:hypothetical protein